MSVLGRKRVLGTRKHNRPAVLLAVTAGLHFYDHVVDRRGTEIFDRVRNGRVPIGFARIALTDPRRTVR